MLQHKDIKEYFTFVTNKKIYRFYQKEALFGKSYFINDAYVMKEYDKEDIDDLSLERLNSVHEIISKSKIGETLISLDGFEKVKITKVVHGDLSYEDEPSESQIRNTAKTLKKLHKNVSENDIPMDIISSFYRYKSLATKRIDKIKENRIVRDVKNIMEKVPIGLCHNYLNKDNIIYRFDNCFFINYELANINYTYFDLASFIIENIKSKEGEELFLNTYFGASYNNLKKKRIGIFKAFLRVYYYYFFQYLYSLTNKDYYLKQAERYE